MKRIHQGRVSQSIADFPFLKSLDLHPYDNKKEPAVFFGIYNDEDYRAVLNHDGPAVVYFAGQDALDCILLGRYQELALKRDCYFAAPAHSKIALALRNFLPVIETRPIRIGPTLDPVPLGEKIFAYVPASFPAYHRHEIIAELMDKLPFKFVVGDGSITQDDWNNGKSVQIYTQCFVGLMLSGFAGGGQTIIEMGMMGRKVITNVLDMPHTIEWKTIADIERAIFGLSKRFDMLNDRIVEISENVKASLDNDRQFLNLEFYETRSR